MNEKRQRETSACSKTERNKDQVEKKRGRLEKRFPSVRHKIRRRHVIDTRMRMTKNRKIIRNSHYLVNGVASVPVMSHAWKPFL